MVDGDKELSNNHESIDYGLKDQNSGRKRVRLPSTRLKHHLIFNIEEIQKEARMGERNPTNFREVIKTIDATKWHETMREKLDPIEKNQVCEITSFLKERKPIGYKYILKKKYKVDVA